MRIRGTDFVMFSVSDLMAAVSFYRDILGLRCVIVSAKHQWAEFDCGNVTLALRGRSLTAGTRAGGQIALAVDDVSEAHETLVNARVHIDGAPTDSGFCIALRIHDPDGNLVILHKRADGTYGQSREPQ